MLSAAPASSLSEAPASSGGDRTASIRRLYYELLHIDEHPETREDALAFCNARLSEVEQSADSPIGPGLGDYGDFDGRVQELRTWWLERRTQLSLSLGDVTREQCVHLLKQYAPTALLDGCWMQNFSTAVNSHTEVAAGILKAYSHEIGDGNHARHHGNAYRDLLQSLGIYLPDAASVSFVEQHEVADIEYSYPVFLLSISQFPRTFRPEIIGLTLFYYVCGICPFYYALRARLAQIGANDRFLDTHDLESLTQEPASSVLGAVNHYMKSQAELDGPDSRWRRIRNGFRAACIASWQAGERGLAFAQSPTKTARERMIELIERKARHAQGYHSHSKLQGRSIDDWMNPADMDPGQFLDALARSRHISPGNAEESRFFRQLVAFRGPMFRIFPPDELRVIADWINSLAQDGRSNEVEGKGTDPAQSTRTPFRLDVGTRSANSSAQALAEQHIRKYAQMTLGEIYHYLLNIEDHPDVRDFARHFATLWLAKAGRGLRRGALPLPFEPYQHHALDSWLDAQAARQLESYHENDGAPSQTREEVIDSTTQLAPMIFIDGAWIQNASKASSSHTAVGGKLFHIYVDEVGNGEVRLNHPNVFRELLAQMKVDLPDFETIEFGRCARFRPESFRVPVFWLSISQFPKSFLAETLGLNLAMELSGVGGSYRTGIDALRHYGFDPCFVVLHNNIDNVSTGHTRLAIDAIKCHLDDMFARGGAKLVEEHWQRIWTGYRALAPQDLKLRRWSYVPPFWKS
jgi:Iron-containing redox enzyme